MPSPFALNEAISQRREHAEDGLREGSPVVGLSYPGGLLVLSVRRSQRKVFEIYDRLIYSAIGNQSDVEAIRVGAIDLAHREGYERSPDDVTAQRMVGFSLSPVLKELYRDHSRVPAVIRAVFGELGGTPDEDHFFVLNYDGEFERTRGIAMVAGDAEAEDEMSRVAKAAEPPQDLEGAVRLALLAWGAGRAASAPSDDDGDSWKAAEEGPKALHEALEDGVVEAAILDRTTRREARYTVVPEAIIEAALASLG